MKWLFGFLFSFSLSLALAQAPSARPKLVVGLVVDQMRWDYLYRFQDRYGADGFRRLLREGYSCENAFIPYTPTVTAAGHSAVYTGSVPALHGIMGNNWYDREKKRVVYCTEDPAVATVGSASAAGKMSPKNLWASTIADELRLATNFRNKTIAIALKDRGAILPGGHTANQAYWFDNATGGWITSTFYATELPAWVRQFNDRKLPDTYLQQNWNTLYPIGTYRQSTADSTPYESRLGSEDFTFPHLTAGITNNRYEVFRNTPFGDTYTLEMARAAVEAEKLGRGSETDFLAVSLSSPDYIGHTFGPNSVEIEDTYLRLDREVASFLRYLDAKVGRGQYLFFLTADHGAAHNPLYLRDQKLPGGVHEEAANRRQLADSLQQRFGRANLIESMINYQVYLNDSLIQGAGLDREAIKSYITSYYLRQPAVSAVIDLEKLPGAALPAPLREMLINGYNHKLSGDIQIIYKPQWFETWRTGTTHGVWNPYDSHIPLLWFGWKVRPGKLHRQVTMADIAPTLAALLQVQMPNATIGQVISEIVR
jgi:predicted AlkP superfamily pyrophosphatase or phosphodiesterase